ncbi:hypothetical protein [Candidatus Spongiihabitans sp.]|uniref:hypothetical protein n=1 Tax=Candidatus Spongiihabitans sp. TaxID=3101308 RepID=UPI003C7DFD3B
MDGFYQQIGKGMGIYSTRFVGRAIPVFIRSRLSSRVSSLDYRVKPDNDGRASWNPARTADRQIKPWRR